MVSPGPVSTAIISQAPRRGWLVGPLIATGHSITEFGIILLIAFGMTAGMENPVVQIIIAGLGGLLLIWMGYNMLVGASKGEIRVPGVSPNSESLSRKELVRLGILTTLSNPFWYAWWATAVPSSMIQIGAVTPLGIAAFYFGHISADYTWDTFLSTVIGGGKRWITDRVYQIIIAACGIYFIYLGIVFIRQAVLLGFSTPS